MRTRTRKKHDSRALSAFLKRTGATGLIQAKERGHRDGAPLEAEADRLASSFMSRSRAGARMGSDSRSSDPGEHSPAAGRPLPVATRKAHEKHFGRGFAKVRIFADAEAGRAAESLGALAFTNGSAITFATGAYEPGTPAGDTLLAHELAHVAQQGEAPALNANAVPVRSAAPGSIQKQSQSKRDLNRVKKLTSLQDHMATARVSGSTAYRQYAFLSILFDKAAAYARSTAFSPDLQTLGAAYQKAATSGPYSDVLRFIKSLRDKGIQSVVRYNRQMNKWRRGSRHDRKRLARVNAFEPGMNSLFQDIIKELKKDPAAAGLSDEQIFQRKIVAPIEGRVQQLLDREMAKPLPGNTTTRENFKNFGNSNQAKLNAAVTRIRTKLNRATPGQRAEFARLQAQARVLQGAGQDVISRQQAVFRALIELESRIPSP